MQDLRKQLEKASISLVDAYQSGHEKILTVDDAYRIAMEFAREEASVQGSCHEWWSQCHPFKNVDQEK